MKINGYFILDGEVKSFHVTDTKRGLDNVLFVRARPHGEWVFKNDNPLIPTGYWECSKCKKGRLMVEENFCPNCGADMRKEGDEK